MKFKIPSRIILWFHHLWEKQPKGSQDIKSWIEDQNLGLGPEGGDGHNDLQDSAAWKPGGPVTC